MSLNLAPVPDDGDDMLTLPLEFPKSKVRFVLRSGEQMTPIDLADGMGVHGTFEGIVAGHRSSYEKGALTFYVDVDTCDIASE